MSGLLPALSSAAETVPSRLGRYELKCPVCRQVFVTLTCVEINTRGGIDRDLFARAVGPQPEYYRVATCPRCGYSGYDADFDDTVVIPPTVRDKILKKPQLPLPKDFTPAGDPRDLDALDRYELAITCYTWLQRSDEALAWLHLRASWIARDEGSALPPDDRLVRVMRFVERYRPPAGPQDDQSAYVPGKSDDQADLEMQMAARIAEALAAGRFSRYQRPYVDLALALILRRHGENRQAGPLIETLARQPDFTPALREALERMLDSIAREKKYQAAAADRFERALLAHQVSAANRHAAFYLLGELNRRLGRDRQAVRWFDEALRGPDLGDRLKTRAAEQRAWSAAGIGP